MKLPSFLARDVHRGCIETFVSIYDNNRQKFDVKDRKSHSFVIGFMGGLSAQLQATTTTAKYTSIAGATTALTDSAVNFQSIAGATVTNLGILVGSGTTTPAPGDSKMTTLITSGSGAGQLEYGASAATDGVIVGGTVLTSCTRTFNNASGAGVTVNEIGLACYLQSTPFLIIHDLLTVVFNNGDNKTATYTIVATT